MRNALLLGLVGAALTGNGAFAGADLIPFPSSYRQDFVLYNKVDRVDTKRIRFLYVNKAALAAAQPGQPIPHGTILVMEDHKPEMNGDQLVYGPNGRLIPTEQILGLGVMQKEAGWGAAYPPKLRNGEWEYASFKPDGSRVPDVKYEGCFTCHLPRVGERDYTFTFAKFVIDGKPALP